MGSNTKNKFIKDLWSRRVPHILGTYAVSASGVVLFLDWMVVRYNINYILTDILLISIVTLLPSICMIAYYHGRPGKDDWQKAELVGIPTNLIFTIMCIVFFVSPDFLSGDEDENDNLFNSLAVMHLTNYSNDLSDDNFCAAITSGVITGLARLGMFDVKARTDVLKFKNKMTSHEEINEILGVDAYIEGSLSKTPDGKKYYADIQLIDAKNGTNLWATRFEKPKNDILNIPNTIVSEIARFLGGGDNAKAITKTSSYSSRERESFSLLGRGINLLDSGKLGLSIEVFDSLLIDDPNNIHAIYYRAQALEGNKRFSDAIENYTQIIPDKKASSRSTKIFSIKQGEKSNKDDKIRFLVSKELNIQLIVYQNDVEDRTNITALDLSTNTELWSKSYAGIGYRPAISKKYFILSSSSFIRDHATIYVHNLFNSKLIFSKEFTRAHNEEIVMVSAMDIHGRKDSAYHDHMILNVRRNDYYQIILLDLINKSIVWEKTIPLQAVAEGDPRIYLINNKNKDYFLHQKGLNFYLYNSITGDRVWTNTLDDDTDRVLVHNNKLIYYSTENTLISVQDPVNNKIIGTLELEAPSISAFGSGDDVIIQSSVGLTSIKTHKPFLRSIFNWKLSIDDDSIPKKWNVFTLGEKLFAFTKSGDLYCVSIKTGKVINVNKLNEYEHWGFITDEQDHIAKGLALYADDFIIGLDPINGETLWKIKELNIDYYHQQIRFVDNKLIVGKEPESKTSIILKAYNRNSGKLLWHSNESISTNETEINFIDSHNKSVYVGTKNLELFSFNIDWTPDKNYIPTSSILNRLAYCHYNTQNMQESENILKEIVGSIDQQNEEAYLQLSDLYLSQQNNRNYISTLSSYYELIQHDELKRGRIENKLMNHGDLQWVQNLRKKYDVVLHSSQEGIAVVSDCDHEDNCNIQAFRSSSGIKLWEKSFSNANFIFSSEQSGKFIFASRNSFSETDNIVFTLWIIDAAGNTIGKYILWDEEQKNKYALWNVYNFNNLYIIDATVGDVRYITAIDENASRLLWEIELEEYRIQRARPIDVVRSGDYLVVPIEDELRFIDVHTGIEDWVFDYTEDIEGVAFLGQEGVADNTISFLSDDNEFVVFDVVKQNISYLEEVDFSESMRIHFLNEAYILAFSNYGSMFLYTKNSSEVLPVWKKTIDPIESVIMSGNNIYTYHGADDFVAAWNFITGEAISDAPLMWKTTNIFIDGKLIGGFAGNKLYILNL